MTHEIDPWDNVPADVQSVLICRAGHVLGAAVRTEPGGVWTATHTSDHLSDGQVQEAMGSTYLRVTSTFPNSVPSLVTAEPVVPFVAVHQ